MSQRKEFENQFLIQPENTEYNPETESSSHELPQEKESILQERLRIRLEELLRQREIKKAAAAARLRKDSKK